MNTVHVPFMYFFALSNHIIVYLTLALSGFVYLSRTIILQLPMYHVNSRLLTEEFVLTLE